MQEPGHRSRSIDGEPSLPLSESEADAGDPYADLERVFDEPIVLEDADLESFETREQAAPMADSAEATEPAPRTDRSPDLSRIWTRLEALEVEVRGSSERTLEALRRLGERIGTELAMLDKRAINLELTIARLRTKIEGSGPGARRPSESPTGAETPDNG